VREREQVSGIAADALALPNRWCHSEAETSCQASPECASRDGSALDVARSHVWPLRMHKRTRTIVTRPHQ
jgi:hypothetical protein